MRAIQEDDRPAGFQFSPVGPFLLRDYSSDDVDDLKLLRGLLEEILTRHKMLVPGSMNRLMVQWRGDVDRGIEASTPEYGPQPGTSADPARSASPREPSPSAGMLDHSNPARGARSDRPAGQDKSKCPQRDSTQTIVDAGWGGAHGGDW
jgi:hypothetical protein